MRRRPCSDPLGIASCSFGEAQRRRRRPALRRGRPPHIRGGSLFEAAIALFDAIYRPELADTIPIRNNLGSAMALEQMGYRRAARRLLQELRTSPNESVASAAQAQLAVLRP